MLLQKEVISIPKYLNYKKGVAGQHIHLHCYQLILDNNNHFLAATFDFTTFPLCFILKGAATPSAIVQKCYALH